MEQEVYIMAQKVEEIDINIDKNAPVYNYMEAEKGGFLGLIKGRVEGVYNSYDFIFSDDRVEVIHPRDYSMLNIFVRDKSKR